MGFGKPKESIEDKERRLEGVQVDDEILSYEASIAEKRAIIAELKRRHGPRWKHILGIKGKLSLADLRASMKTANKGMRQYSGSGIRKIPVTGGGVRAGSDHTGDLRKKLSPLAPRGMREMQKRKR